MSGSTEELESYPFDSTETILFAGVAGAILNSNDPAYGFAIGAAGGWIVATQTDLPEEKV